jgi:hypothetical protein
MLVKPHWNYSLLDPRIWVELISTSGFCYYRIEPLKKKINISDKKLKVSGTFQPKSLRV